MNSSVQFSMVYVSRFQYFHDPVQTSWISKCQVENNFPRNANQHRKLSTIKMKELIKLCTSSLSFRTDISRSGKRPVTRNGLLYRWSNTPYCFYIEHWKEVGGVDYRGKIKRGQQYPTNLTLFLCYLDHIFYLNVSKYFLFKSRMN